MTETAVSCETDLRPQHYFRRNVVVPNDRADHGTSGRLLLIGADRTLIPEQLRRAFPAPEHRVQVAGSAHAALEHVRRDLPDVIVLDLALPDQSGLEVYHEIRRMNPHIPVVVLAGARRADAAIEPIKQGAYDCLFKPLDLAPLRRVVGEALNVARRMRQPVISGQTGTDPDPGSALIGFCPAMQEVYKAIGRVADQEVPVLITGASGTGKEVVARAIYEHSPRAHGPFLALNCAAIPETLLESELFGHEKGAFTGATQRRLGKFEQASGGTLFLDEVGDMPLALQAKMLRLLQEQTFERVGGNETIHTDVRLIAATHCNLKAWSAEGRFRPDLYYRLGVFTIHLPPLRERADDLALLVQHYLRRFSRELGREVREITAEALERLRRYSWPGNVRELQSVLKQALLRSHGPILLPDFLPELSELPEPTAEPAAPTAPREGRVDLEAFIQQRLGPESRDMYKETVQELDRLLLPRVLEYTGANQARAALLLGIARRTLRQKLRDLGLYVTHSVANEDDLP
ncbi:MAG TPA: sigma-54 dependent transcriptional regulator [Gemmataceae bacterium]|nr:sigma-54 dependent transcriptional regulator [Gemmataceae bacterium]